MKPNLRKLVPTPAWIPWLLLAAVYSVFARKNYNFQLDDALIYLRYIENALSGHGLVYNEGIRFNGLTSPLFSYLVLAVSLVIGSAPLGSFLVSSVSLFASAVVMAKVFEEPIANSGIAHPRLVAWLGAALMLFLPYFYLTFGMETGLFTLLSAALILAMRRQQYGISGILAALLFITRSEGGILIAVVGIYELIRIRKLPPFSIATYIAPLLIVGSVFLFNYAYYGSPTPETGMAKVWQGSSGLWTNFLDVYYLYGLVFQSNPLMVGGLFGLACVGAVCLRDRYLLVVAGAYLTIFLAVYVYFKIPNYHWYYSPFFAFIPYCAAAGFGFVATAFSRASTGIRRAALILLAALPVVGVLLPGMKVNMVPRGVLEPYKNVGLWMKQHLSKNDSVAMVEIGTIGYYSGRHVVDILGLVNPYNAKFIGERKFDAWLDKHRATHLFVHEPVWDHEVSFFRAAELGLAERCDFRFDGYKLYKITYGAPGIQSCRGEEYRISPVIQRRELPSGPKATNGGFVDNARAAGNFVRLDGWANTSAGRAYSSLAYIGPQPGRLTWIRKQRPDVAAHLNSPALVNAGFSAGIRFETPEAANEALKGCLAVMGEEDSSVEWLPLKPGNTCD